MQEMTSPLSHQFINDFTYNFDKQSIWNSHIKYLFPLDRIILHNWCSTNSQYMNSKVGQELYHL